MSTQYPIEAHNVLGLKLEPCSYTPLTGFFRDGCCQASPEDSARHTVCAVMSEEFLIFTKQQGNDLSTPMPEYEFPGLKPGDRWCLCALRWLDACEAGVAPPIVLAATHRATLDVISWDTLKAHAIDVPYN